MPPFGTAIMMAAAGWALSFSGFDRGQEHRHAAGAAIQIVEFVRGASAQPVFQVALFHNPNLRCREVRPCHATQCCLRCDGPACARRCYTANPLRRARTLSLNT